MARREKKEIPRFKSPVMVLRYPRLLTPGTFTKKGAKKQDKPAYSTNGVLAGDDAVTFRAQVLGHVAELTKQLKVKVKPPTIKPYVDDDENEVAGALEFKFKVTANIEREDGSTWNRQPFVCDAAGNPIDPKTRIGAGTKARVIYSLYCWNAEGARGLTLQPEAVQILELVEWTPRERSASDFGIEAEEGYVATKAGADDDADGDDASEF